MLTDKLLTLAFGVIFLLTLACSDSPETNKHQQMTLLPATKTSGQTAFFDYAASTSMLQVELGQLAAERGQQEQVKAIGEHALQHHTRALADLRKTVGKDHLTSIPDTLGAADKAIVEEFRNLPAAEFDNRYRHYILSSHTAQLERYQETLQKTEEEHIREWINQMQVHLQERMRLANQAGIAASQ
ncbi:DUF4142 domain-containing protein [Pontibacter roseus]|uniref:DUF4142 domain-containing protein n=1 Tax=Pontibacter roseus TaxID=336989 RepID=UPI00037C14BC|nr:DUF4142 domain-containing protein [Pontibacter roseus]